MASTRGDPTCSSKRYVLYVLIRFLVGFGPPKLAKHRSARGFSTPFVCRTRMPSHDHAQKGMPKMTMPRIYAECRAMTGDRCRCRADAHGPGKK